MLYYYNCYCYAPFMWHLRTVPHCCTSHHRVGQCWLLERKMWSFDISTPLPPTHPPPTTHTHTHIRAPTLDQATVWHSLPETLRTQFLWDVSKQEQTVLCHQSLQEVGDVVGEEPCYLIFPLWIAWSNTSRDIWPPSSAALRPACYKGQEVSCPDVGLTARVWILCVYILFFGVLQGTESVNQHMQKQNKPEWMCEKRILFSGERERCSRGRWDSVTQGFPSLCPRPGEQVWPWLSQAGWLQIRQGSGVAAEGRRAGPVSWASGLASRPAKVSRGRGQGLGSQPGPGLRWASHQLSCGDSRLVLMVRMIKGLRTP